MSNVMELFEQEEKLLQKRFEKLKKDQAELGVVYEEKGAWFFRDGTELTFEEAFGRNTPNGQPFQPAKQE